MGIGSRSFWVPSSFCLKTKKKEKKFNILIGFLCESAQIISMENTLPCVLGEKWISHEVKRPQQLPPF